MKCTFLLLLGLIAYSAQAQWMPETSFPAGEADGAFSIVIGDKVYMNTGPISDEFFAYHPPTNTWEGLGSLPAGVRGWAMAATVDNRLYMFGGDAGGFDPVADCWMYDIETAEWSALPEFPGGDRDAGACFVAYPYIYVGLGFDGQYVHADLYRFDTRDNSWTQMPFYPGGATVFPVSFSIDNASYVTTGDHGGVEGTEMYAFDHATEQWEKKADFPGLARQAAFGFTSDGVGYVGGGMSGYAVGHNDVWAYSAEKDKWYNQGHLNIPVSQTVWCSAFAYDGNAYMGLGLNITDFKFGSRLYKAPLLQIANVEEESVHVKVSPNPASEPVTISYGELQTQPTTLVVVDAFGREVLTSSADVQATTIDVSQLATGMYLVRGLHSNGEVMIQVKVMID